MSLCYSLSFHQGIRSYISVFVIQHFISNKENMIVISYKWKQTLSGVICLGQTINEVIWVRQTLINWAKTTF